MTQQWASSLGIVLDILGAWFLAFEFWRKFEGQPFIGRPLTYGGTTDVHTSREFRQWELKRYWLGMIGLVMLTIGFLLQLCAVWLPVHN